MASTAMIAPTLPTHFRRLLFIFFFGISLLIGGSFASESLDLTPDPTAESAISINGSRDSTTEPSLLPNTSSPTEQLSDEQEKSDQNPKKLVNNANKKSFVDKKDLKLFRWSKERDFRFPIRPPKLRKVNTSSEGLSQKARIGYASALQTRQTDNSTNTTTIRKVRKVKRKRLDSNRPNNQTNFDIFELQSSDQSPSIAVFIPKRLSSKNRLTGEIIVGNIAQQFNKTRKRIPKLLLPKSLRPAMYSLDGFVPRPSLNKIVSTEAPIVDKTPKFQSRRKKKMEEIAKTENKNRRFGGNRNSIEERKDHKKEDIDVSDSRRRSVITKRKSQQSLQTSDSIQKPTVNKLSKDKRKGVPGKDYPTLSEVPKTGFECKDLNNGVYADVETGCQVWHICQNKHKHSFLCPNGTIFNEKNGICDWWYNYDCPKLVKLTDKDDTEFDSIKEKIIQKRAKTKRHSIHRFA